MRTVHRIPFIRWHLENNFIPKLTDQAISRLIGLCKDVNAGKVEWDTLVNQKYKLNVGELLTAYKIELTD